MSGKQFLRLPSSVNSCVEYSDIRKQTYVTPPPLIKKVASKRKYFVDSALFFIRVQYKPFVVKNGNFELEICSRSSKSDLSKKICVEREYLVNTGLM